MGASGAEAASAWTWSRGPLELNRNPSSALSPTWIQQKGCSVAQCAALAAQADDLEPNIGLHWYLAAQLHDAKAPGLQGLRSPTRALLHALAGACLGGARSTLDCHIP